MLYDKCKENNNETNKAMHIINNPATWGAKLLKDIYEFKKTDPYFQDTHHINRPNKR